MGSNRETGRVEWIGIGWWCPWLFLERLVKGLLSGLISE